MYKLFAYALLVIAVAAYGRIMADDKPINQKSSVVDSVSDVMRLSMMYLGTDSLEIPEKSSAFTINKVTSDALKFTLTGLKRTDRVIWQVDVSGVKLEYSGNESIRDYSVFIDSSSGQLLEIHSTSDTYGNKNTYGIPPNNVLLSSLQRKNITIMDSTIECIMSFAYAMAASYSYPNEVYEIIAYYHYGTSPFNQTIRPMWYIILRGFTPAMLVSGGGTKDEIIPESSRNAMILGVDATTGKRQFMMSLP